tara:strand:+ start:600 stop:1487 length:888 start_codon:yes stop_codon:yes gene_type:complete
MNLFINIILPCAFSLTIALWFILKLRKRIRVQKQIINEKNKVINKQSDEILAIHNIYITQKQEALEKLSGGIIHDFNNILYGIMSFTRLAIDETDKKNVIYSYLKHIEKGHKQATTLMNQTASFNKQDNLDQTVSVEVQGVILKLKDQLTESLPVNITLNYDLDFKCKPIEINPDHLPLIIKHIFSNSIHAIGDSVGEIKISLAETILTNEETEVLQLPVSSKYAKLTIEDKGRGITTEDLDKIYDPYFSTNARSKGLGLSITRGMILTNDGAITINSDEQTNTRVSIYFPINES